MEKIRHERQQFVWQGRVVYEWDQSLDEVNVYAAAPPGVRAAHIDCRVDAARVRLGLKGNPPMLDEALWARAKAGDSLWTLEDGVVHVTIAKAVRGEAWPAAFARHVGASSPSTTAAAAASAAAADASAAALADPAERARRELMLERFQEEHPGFDFSGATFSGAAPDPASFMRDVEQQ